MWLHDGCSSGRPFNTRTGRVPRTSRWQSADGPSRETTPDCRPRKSVGHREQAVSLALASRLSNPRRHSLPQRQQGAWRSSIRANNHSVAGNDRTSRLVMMNPGKHPSNCNKPLRPTHGASAKESNSRGAWPSSRRVTMYRPRLPTNGGSAVVMICPSW